MQEWYFRSLVASEDLDKLLHVSKSNSRAQPLSGSWVPVYKCIPLAIGPASYRLTLFLVSVYSDLAEMHSNLKGQFALNGQFTPK